MHKVLIIDDEKPTLTMFRLFLGAYGYEVLVAEDGKTGLDLLSRENPAIVFTDLKMPGMDGFEVLKQVKRLAPQTEVIVITGHGDMDLVIRALNLEATDFINKPVQRSALDAALKRAENRIRTPEVRNRSITTARQDAVIVIHIRGTLDGSSRAQLMAIYEQACTSDTAGIVLDFDPNASINGAGLTLVTQLFSDVKKKGKNGAVCGLSENYKTIFDMLGITRTLKIFDTAADAVTGLPGK